MFKMKQLLAAAVITTALAPLSASAFWGPFGGGWAPWNWGDDYYGPYGYPYYGYPYYGGAPYYGYPGWGYPAYGYPAYGYGYPYAAPAQPAPQTQSDKK